MVRAVTGAEYSELYKKSRDRACDALFESYCDYVYAIVHSKIRSVASIEDIEECVSDIFAEVFFGYDSEKDRSCDMKGYIGTVAKRRAINEYHRLTVRAKHFSSESYDEIISDTDIESESDKEETSKILKRTIDGLGNLDSTIILQKYYHDRTSEEIGEMLSMKGTAVRMRTSRALKKLKKALSADGFTV